MLFTGNELLIGKTLNTNSQWLARKITSLGGRVKRMYVIEDDLEEMRTIIQYILKERSPDFLVISGGLGPTFDDKTLEGVGLALDLPLKINDEALNMIKEKYDKIHKEGISKTDKLIESRVKMAKLPEGATPLPNPYGTAPGVLLKKGTTTIVCLPGVPAELKGIFEESIEPLIKKNIKGIKFYEAFIKTEGIVESELAEYINKVMHEVPYVYIKSHPQGYEEKSRINIHITVSGSEEMQEYLNKAIQKIKEVITELGGKII